MIVDSSALVAILTAEAERDSFVAELSAASSVGMSAATYLEAAIVIDSGRNPVVSRQFDDLLAALDVEVCPVTADQARVARAAYRDFGKGSGHPAGLNYGDCFSYALAKVRDEPLLFKGDDFVHTDVRRAAPGGDAR